MKELKKIKYWLFDLDNTLYSGETKVFDQVDKKMSSFISKKLNVDIKEARIIQKKMEFELAQANTRKQDLFVLFYIMPL